jgi:nitrogen-specific signal transduction histidine kinase
MKNLYPFTKTREDGDSLKVRPKYKQKTRQQFNGLIYKRSQQFGTDFRIYLGTKIMTDCFYVQCIHSNDFI